MHISTMATFTGDLFSFTRLVLIATLASLTVDARPSDSGAPSVPLWRKYFRNDTLTGSLVPCTDEEKFCLERGLLLHKESGKCYLRGKDQPCTGTSETFQVDKKEFLATGHVRGACVKRYLCDSIDEYKMAADGSCMNTSTAAQICYSQGVSISDDLFGESECACSYGDCPVPTAAPVTPPSDVPAGQCFVPNLRHTDLPSHPYDRKLSTPRSEVPCTETERRCLLDGRIYLAARDLCFSLWEQGPCEEGQWFALAREEAVNGTGKLTGVCQPAPCPAGRVKAIQTPLYPFGSCVTPRELCAGGYHVSFDMEGLAACSWSPFVSLRMPTESKGDGVCRFPGVGDPATATDHFYPPAPSAPSACPESKTGYCDRNVTAPAAA